MATFYLDSKSNKSYSSQWTEYLNQQSRVKDITTVIDNKTKEYKRINNTQAYLIENSISKVCGTLEIGFELLSDNLQNISFEIGEIRSEIKAMSSMLDWNLSLMIEQQRITNLLTGNIAVLLRIPDIQKERQYYIEQGLKFFTNATHDEDFFEDSLVNLLKAEKIEPTDYFTLHKIGLIYLYSTKHINIKLAEEYFKRSAKYAVAETSITAITTTNFLSGDLNYNLVEQSPTIEILKFKSAESYLFVSRCCYIQGKFEEAAIYAGKAFGLVPQMTEAGFTQAKALAAFNKNLQAAEILEEVIIIDKSYSIKAILDNDLYTKEEIHNTLKKLYEEIKNDIDHLTNQCRQIKKKDSIATDYLNKILELSKKNTYLAYRNVQDLLNEKKDWDFNCAISNTYLNNLIDVYKSYEREVDIHDFDIEIMYVNKRLQWNFLTKQELYSKYIHDKRWEDTVSYKKHNSDLLSFLKTESNYFEEYNKIMTVLKIKIEKKKKENLIWKKKVEKKENFIALLKTIYWALAVIAVISAYEYLDGVAAFFGVIGIIIAIVVINGFLSDKLSDW